MKHERKFKDRESYEDHRANRERRRSKGHRGDVGTGEMWADMFAGDESMQEYERDQRSRPPRQYEDRQPAPAAKPGPAFQFNESATIDVKGYKIDLSRVKDLSKTQTVHNGKDSFGIAFLFVGKKGLGRTIWYGTNYRQRDDEFSKYSEIWEKVKP